MRRGEVDDHVEGAQVLRRKPGGIGIVLRFNAVHAMAAFARDIGNQRSSLTSPQHEQVERAVTQSKTSGSTSAKNLACSRRTASGTSASSITNVRLISEAPCEIIRTLIWRMVSKTCAATPGVSRRFSPTRQTIAFLPEYFTNASSSRSA